MMKTARALDLILLTSIVCSFVDGFHRSRHRLQTLPSPSSGSIQSQNEDHKIGVAESRDHPHGYIIIPLRGDLGDTEKLEHPTIGTSTARIQEIVDDGDDANDVKSDTSGGLANETGGVTVNFNYMFGGYVRREIWAIPLISLILINLCLIVFFEVYVLCQSRGQTPLFLGQFLLLGLALCSGFSLVFVVSPGFVNCFLGTIGISVSYALIFSVLLVKAIFLISLDSGNNLTLTYQGCLLFFSVLVQVAISTQSALIFPPSINQVNSSTDSRSLWSECDVGFEQMLWPMTCYNVFLIVMVGLLSIKIRRIQENYGEATYIGFAILATIPIWICWILAACVLQGRHLDACVAFGCQAQSLFTFLIIFMPKGRQLATMAGSGKLLAENQEDEYSPSFFHIDPGKLYKKGIGFGTDRYSPTSYSNFDAPTFSAMNPNVYFYKPDFHPGMIY